MEQNEILKKLKSGLRKLYREDAEILEPRFDLNERTITFRLGMYLCAQFKNFDVDCEYNRMVDHTGTTTGGDYWAKKVNLERNDVTGDDDEARTVFPDIIIHKRKRPENLVVIEVKIAWKNSRKDFDYKKLRAYKEDLKYQYANYLEIGEKKSSIEFI